MTNGICTDTSTNSTSNSASTSHGEADVSSNTTAKATAASLQDVCAALNAQVQAFLASSAPDDVTRRTQEQTRIAMGVVETAVREYQ